MTHLRMFIDGERCESESGRSLTPSIRRPCSVIAQVPEGTRADADRPSARRTVPRRAWRACRSGTGPELLHRDRRRNGEVDERSPRAPCPRTRANRITPRPCPKSTWLLADFAKQPSTRSSWRRLAITVKDTNKRVWSVRQPRGVCAMVTPWNFPINIPVEYLAPGLAMGNAIVWAPAPTTSVCAVRLMECLERADLPAGAVSLVTGPGPVVGHAIVAHPLTAAVGFTGSPATGKKVAEAAAGKPMLLELGGNGPRSSWTTRT